MKKAIIYISALLEFMTVVAGLKIQSIVREGTRLFWEKGEGPSSPLVTPEAVPWKLKFDTLFSVSSLQYLK